MSHLGDIRKIGSAARLTAASQRIVYALGLWLCFSLTLTCCKDSPDTESATNEGAVSETDKPTVLVESGSLKVTYSDLQKSMRESLLFAPSAPEVLPEKTPTDRLARPFVRRRAVDQILAGKIIESLSKKFGIEVTDAKLVETLRSNDKLSKYTPYLSGDKPLPSELKSRDIGRKDLRNIARDIFLRKQVQQKLIETLSPTQLWQLYVDRHFKLELLTARTTNTPGSAEIDAFIRRDKQRESSKIKKYFREHQKQFELPPRVRADLVRVPGGRNVEANELEKLAKAARSGTSLAEVARKHDLQHRKDQVLRKAENKEAFRAEPGTVGTEIDGPRGTYIWKVTDKLDARTPNLDASLRREIAAEILENKRVVESAKIQLKKIKPAFAKLPAPTAESETPEKAINRVKKRARDLDIKVERTGTVRRGQKGRVGKLGLHEKLYREAFQLTPSDPKRLDPIVDRGDAWIFALIDYNRPEKEKNWKDEVESFRSHLKKNKASLILRKRLNRWKQKHDVSYNLEPLKQKFGTASK